MRLSHPRSPTLPTGSRILGKFCCQLLESLVGIQTCQHTHGASFSFRVVLDRIDQDVARAAIFFGLEPIALLLVEVLQNLVRDFDVAGEIRPDQLQVLDIHAFLGEKPISIGLVVRQYLRLIDFNLVEKAIDRKQRIGDLPFLFKQLDVSGEFRRCIECRHADAVSQVHEPQLFSLLLFECRR